MRIAEPQGERRHRPQRPADARRRRRLQKTQREIERVFRSDPALSYKLLQIAQSPSVLAEVEAALTQDFSKDLAKLKVKLAQIASNQEPGTPARQLMQATLNATGSNSRRRRTRRA